MFTRPLSSALCTSKTDLNCSSSSSSSLKEHEDGYFVNSTNCAESASEGQATVNKSGLPTWSSTPYRSLRLNFKFENIPVLCQGSAPALTLGDDDLHKDIHKGGGGVLNHKKKNSDGRKNSGQNTTIIDRSDVIRKSSAPMEEIYSWDPKSQLGEGGFGSVFLVTHKLTGLKRAAKRIPKATLKDDWGMLENEVKSMMELDHPHICRLFEYFEDKTDIYLILELLEGPDLFDRILETLQDPKKKRFNEYESGVILRHMLKAIFCCHSANIVHRDVKPENFMFLDKAPGAPLKMIDLGLANRGTNVDDMEGMRGTVAYMAPEMLKGEHYNRTCDIWSLGIVLYIMLTGEPLFNLSGADDLAIKQILNPSYLKKKLNKLNKRNDISLSKDAVDILNKMLSRDPNVRIRAQEALAHPFVMKTYANEAGWGVNKQKSEKGELKFSRSESVKQNGTNILKMSDVLERMREFSELPLLKRTALIVLAHMIGTSSNMEEVNRISLTFRLMDLDGGGSLTMDEFVEAVKRESKSRENFEDPAQRQSIKDLVNSDTFKDTIWSAVDMNDSGDLNFTEFLAACMLTKDDPENPNKGNPLYKPQHWKAVFGILDANGGGTLSWDDLIMLFPENDEATLRKMFDEVARGKSELTRDDFVEAMMDTKKQ